MDNFKLKKYLKQIQDFLNDGSKERKVELTIRKEGPDAFSVQYGPEAIGVLLMMIASDPDLTDLAIMALVKRFADADPEKLEDILAQFRKMCFEARQFTSANQHGRSLLVHIPSGKILN